MMNNCPENRNEWWNLVEKNKKDLSAICLQFCNYEDPNSYFILHLLIESYIKDKDRKFARLLAQAWENAPDNNQIHSIPGWNILCNLLSEEYVLDEREDI